jgi:hypothetical protein
MNASCCEDHGYDEKDVDGECPDCGGPTVEGDAVDQCGYSPVTCETCNSRPCDQSC